LENNHKELITSAKDLLINTYKYPEEQVIVDYPVPLKDGSTFKADLVLTKEPSVPYVIVFVTSDANAIPVEQVKMIVSQSSLQYGVVCQINEDVFSGFWGIEKKTNTFTGKLEFKNITDCPKLFKLSNVDFREVALNALFTLLQGG